MLYRCLVAILLLSQVLAAEMRQWTSKDGRTMKAELIWHQDGNIIIRRDDGTEFTVDVGLFSRSDRAYVSQWKAPELTVPELNDAIYIIQATTTTGSGFLTQDTGQVYLYTNQHVIQGYTPAELKAANANGKKLKLGKLQIIPNKDIARIRVDAPGGFKLAADVKLEEQIRAIGNSGGAGVLTVNKGKVNGLGSGLVEVTADIIPGNSGGPILNEADEVVGIATFIATADAVEKQDWKLEGTRYSGTRRFGLRLLPEMKWKDVKWERHALEGKLTRQLKEDVNTWLQFHQAIFADPSNSLQVDEDATRILKEVAKEQNEQARRFNAKLGNAVNPSELERMNRYENRKLSERIEENLEDLMRHIEAKRRANGGIEIPYFQKEVDDIKSQVKVFKAIIEKELKKERTFFIYR